MRPSVRACVPAACLKTREPVCALLYVALYRPSPRTLLALQPLGVRAAETPQRIAHAAGPADSGGENSPFPMQLHHSTRPRSKPAGTGTQKQVSLSPERCTHPTLTSASIFSNLYSLIHMLILHFLSYPGYACPCAEWDIRVCVLFHRRTRISLLRKWNAMFQEKRFGKGWTQFGVFLSETKSPSDV